MLASCSSLFIDVVVNDVYVGLEFELDFHVSLHAPFMLKVLNHAPLIALMLITFEAYLPLGFNMT